MLWISEKRSFKVEMFGTPVCSTFCSTKGGREAHFFAFFGKIKNPDFRWKSGFYVVLLFFTMVPPGIEPGTQGFSVLCSTNWAMAPISFCECKFTSYFDTGKAAGCFFAIFGQTRVVGGGVAAESSAVAGFPAAWERYVLRPTLSASVAFSRYSQRPRNITHREPSGVQNSSFNISQTVAIC